MIQPGTQEITQNEGKRQDWLDREKEREKQRSKEKRKRDAKGTEEERKGKK